MTHTAAVCAGLIYSHRGFLGLMAESARARPIVQAETLLTYYGFDLSGYTVNRTIQDWLYDYRADWIPAAIIEALYQGRYKAVSVSQILSLWKRRGQPLRHFNHEFETIICRELPYPAELTSLLLPSPQSAAPRLLPHAAKTEPHQPQSSRLVQDARLSSTVPNPSFSSTGSQIPSASIPNPIAPVGTGAEADMSAVANDRVNDADGVTNDVQPNQQASIGSDDTSDSAAAFDAKEVETMRPTTEGLKCDRTSNPSDHQPAPPPTEAAEQLPAETNSTSDAQQAPEAIPPFQPVSLGRQSELRVLRVISGGAKSGGAKSGVTPPDSIHQFIPEVSLSNTHAKLKAVAKPDTDAQQH